jgi:hypothetical protein
MNWEFELILVGIDEEMTDEMLNSLYEAGCSDASVGTRSGHIYLDFARDAEDYAGAVASALADVERAGYKAEVI